MDLGFGCAQSLEDADGSVFGCGTDRGRVDDLSNLGQPASVRVGVRMLMCLLRLHGMVVAVTFMAVMAVPVMFMCMILMCMMFMAMMLVFIMCMSAVLVGMFLRSSLALLRPDFLARHVFFAIHPDVHLGR